MSDKHMTEIHRQVMWNRLLAVVEEQARTLMNTAFSAPVREAGDLSAGIFDRHGRMIAQAVTGTPGHVNSMAEAVRHFLHEFPLETMSEGDHYISNDPWRCSGHLHDVTMVSPAFRHGRPVALFACTCHLVDIGGLGQGPDGRSVFEEGLFIPILRFADQTGVDHNLMRLIRSNVRTPDEVEGDLLSYVTSNDTGALQLNLMMDEFGIDSLDDLAATIIDRSREAMMSEIALLPKGTWRNQMTLDGYDSPVVLAAALTVDDGNIHIDFEGSSPASKYGINVVLNYCKAYSAYGVRCVVAPHVPNNAGSLAPITVSAPENSILNASYPRPVSARHIIGQFLPDVVMGCLAQALPDRVPAEGASCIWGAQLRGGPEVEGADKNQRSFDILFFNSGGSGARPTLDGLSATAFPSGVRAASTEILELMAPIVLWRKELRPGSGGAGQYRGGLGQVLEIGTVDGAPFAISAMFDRVGHAARARASGKDGAPGCVSLLSGSHLSAKGYQHIAPGDRLCLELPGGGGFGNALEREPSLVCEEVWDDLLSEEEALSSYGVVVDDDGVVDLGSTANLRETKKEGL